MTNLPSKLESFFETMREGEEFARHGFELLTKRSTPEQYFNPLSAAGFFDPTQNSGPVPSNREGFVQIPFWSALNYLEVVAKRADELNDHALAEKVMNVVREVSNFRDIDGSARDNYHTYRKFAEILGYLPIGVVTLADIDLIPAWLTSRYDRGGVGKALGDGLLKKLLAVPTQENVERACHLMSVCMAFRWLAEDDPSGKGLVTEIDDYWLKAIVDSHAKTLGVQGGLQAVKIFENGLRIIFSDPRRNFGSSLWRPAVETNSQNASFRGPENRYVEGMRNALSGWLEASPNNAVNYVKATLSDESGIIKRIAIHAVTEHFELLRDVFEEAINVKLFSSECRHELYQLLSEKFAGLSESAKAKVISALRALPVPRSGEDRDRRLKYTQREWLTAIKTQPEAAVWFAELSADPELGSPSDHPDFLSYHEVRSGPGPTPFGEDSLMAFAEDGSIVDRLNDFEGRDSWKGPTVGGLVAALENAVATAPNTFLPLLANFHQAKVSYQHALISGFKRVFEASTPTDTTFDWRMAWPKLMTFFEECLAAEQFWEPEAEQNRDLLPTRSWMASLIADLLEAGTKTDETAYPVDLLPRGWELIKLLLARTKDTSASLSDPMSHALNTQRGRAIGAMYNHALRVCRVAQQAGQPVEEAWATLVPVFDQELGKCRDANFDFTTLSASYIANIDYMSHDWLVANINGLFNKAYPANLKAAFGGLAYATPTHPIYQLLSSNGILEAGMNSNLEDSHSRERIIEWICLAYLWGDETLTSPLMVAIFAGGTSDLSDAAEFFWRVQGNELTPEQIEGVLAFWEKCLAWAKGQTEPPEHLLSRLGRLAPSIGDINERTKALLFGVVPFVHTDYSSDQMVEQLARLSDTNLAATMELLERMFEVSTPDYDMDDKLKTLLRKLADAGHRAAVLRCIEKLRKTLPGMLELYKKILAEAPTAPST
ncbi:MULTISPECIES: hypothetical protein [unclassified Mesorhizobium]|uniref:hypothetical protein n=1 Tax=unclassified Mesorhizobium TaxID=325217 RepID=UPI001093FB9C|nr:MULTISPECIES: hypothetical protein [unclassified Mesorhizobium]TGT87189.1 hypothetical protein EN804_19020 [Mesorhizobium sp. M8A.F.Ca.ET.161.01.1.1]TGV41055.1 hypothetical protein EN785_19005 [Mesorhizobium sp. M8A.F.Ca.ET.142.01.1.1]